MNGNAPAYGLWSLAIVNSAVFILFAFSFFKPRTGRDWRSFGAYSGFVVALFAEMYGFPLTIYLLSGWLGSRLPGVDWLSHDAGHLLEMAFGWRSNPHFGPFHLLSFAFIAGGFWLLAAAWRVLYAAQRSGQLAQTGPYAHVRHPQYAAFVLIMFGFLLQWPTLLTLAMFPVLCWMYLRLAIAEENEALCQFGNEWWQYARRTPRFWPRFSAGTGDRVGAIAWLVVVAALSWSAPAQATEPSAREVLDRVERLLWGSTLQGEYEMTITTPRWQRTLALRVWMERPKRSFVRITAPAKEAGIGSLRIGSEMWNYLPNVERIVKIPPSMMLQPWMGSDFTNDDLVKESSILEDYTHRMLPAAVLDGQPSWQIEAIPKPDAAVVWGRIVYWVRKSDAIPLKQEFYSERGELVRVLAYSDVRTVGGRTLPTRWEMRPLAKPGNFTAVVLKDARFNEPVDDAVFTQRNLQKP